MIKSLAITAALTAVAFAAPAMAQSANGTGSITVLRPLTVANNNNLNFGTVARPTTGSGTAVVSNAGVRSVTGGVVGLTLGAAVTAAQFTVAGEGGQAFSVVIPATFSMAGPSASSLVVTTSNDLVGAANAQTLSNALGAAGNRVINIGGSVPITDATVTGAYTGSFTVSASYN